MTSFEGWSRRRFLAVSSGAAAAGLTTLAEAQGDGIPRDPAASQAANAREAAAAMPPPGVITGGTRPLLHGMTSRPLRYTPQAREFVIRNGSEYFNRPLYGPNIDFRVDAGDLPEFSLYLPGHGGNLKLGFIASNGQASKWAAQAHEIVARYRPGRMIYEIRDPLLGPGTLRAELLTSGTGPGILLQVEGRDLPSGTLLAWAFAGLSGRKGKRNGDIGCEDQPVSQFFQVRKEECAGNVFEPIPGSRDQQIRIKSPAAELLLCLPNTLPHTSAEMTVAEFPAWTAPPDPDFAHPLIGMSKTPFPILRGSVQLTTQPMYFTLDHVAPGTQPTSTDPAATFATRSAQVESIASTITLDTPDPYINAAAPALAIAADALWDARQQCVMHGAVAWRVPLAGWRGPYVLDALGQHDRARLHFRHWLSRQNLTPIDTANQLHGEATGPGDPKVHLARKEQLLHSNGDLSNNHYDMNLVFFDVLLRHLLWTGDLDFAREIWPAFQRHLAWERRLFRRTYTSTTGRELPLYEAYAAIWASDNLQYNGGGTAHSSAYMIFALRRAAQLATLLGEDPAPYAAEAEAIHTAMRELLWIPERGLYAESKDLLATQAAYTNPALWTVYHTLDSEVPNRRQAWEICAERLAALRPVPIHGPGVPEQGLYMLACSDWLPYMWSLNLLLMGENMHFALALWQAGMRDHAFRIFKGQLLDSMYMGLCPGDFHMTSALDVHRQEAQRDFGDPIGISSRALLEGLFGIQPDLLTGVVRIRPGFPSEWNRASLKHPDFDFSFTRTGLRETYRFTSRLSKPTQLTLALPARTTSLPRVTINGAHVPAHFNPEAVGTPELLITLPQNRTFDIEILWHGQAPVAPPAPRTCRIGQALELPRTATPIDPTPAIVAGKVALLGTHTVFAGVHSGDCTYTLPITFTAAPEHTFQPIPTLNLGARTEPLDLSPILHSQITEVFTRGYTSPRSPFCSLSIPDTLLGGWANPDGMARIDDTGRRQSGGTLHTPLGIEFRTPAAGPNCAFVSHWQQDQAQTALPLTRRASGIYLLMAGTTLPQCSRLTHGTISISYTTGAPATLELRNPETWWPIEQDYLLDDFLFVNNAPLPPRVDLRTGETRLLDHATFKGRGRMVPGGAATILHLPLDPTRTLATLHLEAHLYGVVLGLLAATLVRA